jgi:hypothetical protein
MANGLGGKNGLEASGKKRPGAKARGTTRAKSAIQQALRKRSDVIGLPKSTARARSTKRRAFEQRPSGNVEPGEVSREFAKYLQDHFAGARVGLELARRLAAKNTGGEIETLVQEIEIDRILLKQVMEILDVEFGPVKQASAWLGGKFVQLRPTAVGRNGSSLGRLLELESLSLGVEGKALLWQALIELKDLIPRLGPVELERALVRARIQRDLLETLRLQAARALAAS